MEQRPPRLDLGAVIWSHGKLCIDWTGTAEGDFQSIIVEISFGLSIRKCCALLSLVYLRGSANFVAKMYLLPWELDNSVIFVPHFWKLHRIIGVTIWMSILLIYVCLYPCFLILTNFFIYFIILCFTHFFETVSDPPGTRIRSTFGVSEIIWRNKQVRTGHHTQNWEKG